MFVFLYMSSRFMQLMCFFDLPTITAKDRREYRKFRKLLLKNGFVMVEESVYTRMVINGNSRRALESLLRDHKPPKGIVALLTVTEKQFANMEMITGEYESNVISSKDRVVEV